MVAQQTRQLEEGLLADLPLRRRTVDVDGNATSVIEGGRGSPLVLLHGGIQVGGAVWWRALPALLARYRVVVPDLPGLGRSAPLPTFDAPRFAHWLHRLLELTCAEPPALVAHSASGALAARFAAEHTDSLGRIILVDAAGLRRFRPSPRFLMALLRANAAPSPANSERFLRHVMADLDHTRVAGGKQWATFVDAVASRSDAPGVRRAMRQLVKAGTRPLPDDRLGQIRVPTALLWGRDDPLYPVRIAESISAARGWSLRVVEAAGHLPHVEQPEAFVAALDDLTDASV